jgi:heme exporter protein A
MYSLEVKELSKRFGSRQVFAGLSFELQTGRSLAVVGRNGSGKSTLLMLLLGLHYPSKGELSFRLDGSVLDDGGIRASTSLVAPYLNLYDQLTGEENMVFMATLSGVNLTGKEIASLLARVGLVGRGDDLVAGYSSGMKQRLKYAVAMIKNPGYLFLDEPTSNLDADGKKIVRNLIEERRSHSIVVIATNEEEEYSLADDTLRLDQ